MNSTKAPVSAVIERTRYEGYRGGIAELGTVRVVIAVEMDETLVHLEELFFFFRTEKMW